MDANADRNRELKAGALPVAGMTATVVGAVVGAVVAAMPSAALAERITDYAPFVYDTEAATVLYLEGDINSQTDFRLGRALHAFPEVETLVLSSRGGTVYDGLSMSTTIREYGLKTHIPADGECYSACAYMFFAGVERGSEGKLGVHRLAGLGDDITFGQEVLSEVFASLYSYGVPFEIVLKMLQTPPERMFIYQPQELAALNLLGPVGANPTPQTAPQSAGAIADALLASDPGAFIAFLDKRGSAPELTTDQVGDPMIVFTEEGEAEYLLFYDCTDNADCLAVQFYAGYQLDNDVQLDVLNAWNGGLTRRFTRAFVADDGSVNLEMDIATSRDGISQRDFRDLLGLWLGRRSEFESQIGF